MIEDRLSLQNSVALVTGGGKGIGRAIALRFASEGADIAIVGRTGSALEKVTKEIESLGRHAIAVVADVADEAQVEHAKETVIREYSRIDILVNNAGISIEKPFVEFTMSEWDQIQNTNSRGTVLCTKIFLPAMIRRDSGVIINIASAAGLRGLPGSTAYSASKAAVIAFSQALGDELKNTGIRINVICPGPVETPLLRNSKVKSFVLSSAGELFQPEDVASSALFLASSLSSGMNSQVVTLRGMNRW